MNRKEFTKKFAEKYGISIATSKEVCKVFDFLAEVIDQEDKVYLYNLGTFKHKLRKEKRVKHPVTGELINIPARDEITFARSATEGSVIDEEDANE